MAKALNDIVKRLAELRLSQPLNDFSDPTFKSTIHSLVKSFKINGDDDFALEVLIAHEVLFIKQGKRVNNYHDREDLIILLIEEFYQVLHDFDPNISSFSNLLSKRLGWRAGKYFERDKLEGFVLLDTVDYEPNPSPEEPTDVIMSYQAHKMLDYLTPKERCYVEDVIISGLSMSEFRNKHSMSPSYARMTKMRALEKLREAHTEVYKDGIL